MKFKLTTCASCVKYNNNKLVAQISKLADM